MEDDQKNKAISGIPLLKTKAGPRDKDLWVQRLKEEYQVLITYVKNNKESNNDWFRLESNKEGTRWFGKCWFIQDYLKYEFEVEFDIPVTYPLTAPEITLPELDGKTAKMYRGGKICLTDHFKPLWARNVPKFGIAHAMALGLAPWLAIEIPELIRRKLVHYIKPERPLITLKTPED
ncbi:PREDICTED: ubiquitin-fold modifier-conjugating enzyme 1 [Polistes dominula]|uniref:Ubiquitin-fold modifier-conjugating enzyme 1 n=1 Tax=Polistes dominula TaxID=743375 RepID=A0ABM1I2H2_POLDO|nr:PREDICTED: ubiquitin-fold modifier-conjugating enzyme 1 [Polistes dominula]